LASTTVILPSAATVSSAGITRHNFPDGVALGLVPVTVCTDLLKPGGYARAAGYLQALTERMEAVGAASVPEFIARAYGPEAGGDPVGNTEAYVERATLDPRYSEAQNRKPPRKIGRTLQLFDCVTCDKCVPVCPNDANFSFVLPRVAIPRMTARLEEGRWRWSDEGALAIDEPRQFGNFADFCNDCGNCDVFCPEDGGPYLLKPRVFGSEEDWRASRELDGFFLERRDGTERVLGRFDGEEFRLALSGPSAHYTGRDFDVTFVESDPEHTLQGQAAGGIPFVYFQIMNALRRALLAGPGVTYVNAHYRGATDA
jgi:putative selenate reductase